MFRRFVPLLLVSLCATGCVPVTEPVSDVEKAEPDKELVGKWTVTSSKGTANLLDIRVLTVDTPVVKGNPKGLMRLKMKVADNENDVWFSLSTVGKETYANLIITQSDSLTGDFSKEGDFAKWQKEPKKELFVVRFTRKGDELTLDAGNYETFGKLMDDAKIEGNGKTFIQTYATPAGWLDKYLAKTGPAKIYDGTNTAVLKREKK